MPVISSVFEAGAADTARRNSEIKKEWLTKEVGKKEANAKKHTEFLEKRRARLCQGYGGQALFVCGNRT